MAGTPVAQIKKRLHCSTQLIAAVRRSNVDLPPVNRGGANRILIESDVENLKLLGQKKELLTRKDCMKHCKDVFGKVVSKKTVIRELRRVGVQSYVARSKPPVSTKN